MKNLFDRARLFFSKDKEFRSALYQIMGFCPHNIDLYRTAFAHKSHEYRSKKTGNKPLNNERLEFLGDAVLETVVSHIVYRQYPNKREGFLTNTRSKIVSRESLGKLAKELGIDRLIQSQTHGRTHNSYLEGNSFEALMGAIYLDRGFRYAFQFIEKRIIGAVLDLDTVANKEVNFKSKLLEWKQKNRIHLDFVDNVVNSTNANSPSFHTSVVIEGIPAGEGKGFSKKESHQAAAKDALTQMRRDAAFLDAMFRAKEKRTAMGAEEFFALPHIAEIDEQIAKERTRPNSERTERKDRKDKNERADKRKSEREERNNKSEREERKAEREDKKSEREDRKPREKEQRNEKRAQRNENNNERPSQKADNTSKREANAAQKESNAAQKDSNVSQKDTNVAQQEVGNTTSDRNTASKDANANRSERNSNRAEKQERREKRPRQEQKVAEVLEASTPQQSQESAPAAAVGAKPIAEERATPSPAQPAQAEEPKSSAKSVPTAADDMLIIAEDLTTTTEVAELDQWHTAADAACDFVAEEQPVMATANVPVSDDQPTEENSSTATTDHAAAPTFSETKEVEASLEQQETHVVTTTEGEASSNEAAHDEQPLSTVAQETPAAPDHQEQVTEEIAQVSTEQDATSDEADTPIFIEAPTAEEATPAEAPAAGRSEQEKKRARRQNKRQNATAFTNTTLPPAEQSHRAQKAERKLQEQAEQHKERARQQLVKKAQQELVESFQLDDVEVGDFQVIETEVRPAQPATRTTQPATTDVALVSQQGDAETQDAALAAEGSQDEPKRKNTRSRGARSGQNSRRRSNNRPRNGRTTSNEAERTTAAPKESTSTAPATAE